MAKFSTVFVTVGTTKFDDLMSEIDSLKLQAELVRLFGVSKIVVQYGNSEIKPTSVSCIIFIF